MKTKQFEAGRNKLCVEMLRGHYAESAFPVLRSIPNKPLTGKCHQFLVNL